MGGQRLQRGVPWAPAMGFYSVYFSIGKNHAPFYHFIPNRSYSGQQEEIQAK